MKTVNIFQYVDNNTLVHVVKWWIEGEWDK